MFPARTPKRRFSENTKRTLNDFIKSLVIIAGIGAWGLCSSSHSTSYTGLWYNIGQKRIFSSPTKYTQKVNEDWARICPFLKEGYKLKKTGGRGNQIDLDFNDSKSIPRAEMSIRTATEDIAGFSFTSMPRDANERYTLSLNRDSLMVISGTTRDTLEVTLRKNNPEVYLEAKDFALVSLNDYRNGH